MWLAPATHLAADTAAGSDPSLYVVGGLAALATVLAALLAMRGTFRQADVQREQALDAAVDRDRQTLREDRDSLRAQLATKTADYDALREKYVHLRVAIRQHGLDPDNL